MMKGLGVVSSCGRLQKEGWEGLIWALNSECLGTMFHFRLCKRHGAVLQAYSLGSISHDLLPTVFYSSDCGALQFQAGSAESAGYESLCAVPSSRDGCECALAPVLICSKIQNIG